MIFHCVIYSNIFTYILILLCITHLLYPPVLHTVVYIDIYIYICIISSSIYYIFISLSYLATSLRPRHRWWFVRWIIPKWPNISGSWNHSNLPRNPMKTKTYPVLAPPTPAIPHSCAAQFRPQPARDAGEDIAWYHVPGTGWTEGLSWIITPSIVISTWKSLSRWCLPS